MQKLSVLVLLAGLLHYLTGCAAKKEITLPELDTAGIIQAEALVLDYNDPETEGFHAPEEIIRGRLQGAGAAMGGYVGATFQGGEEGVILLLLAPILLPTSGIVGVAMAYSDEEVEAASKAFKKVGDDPVIVSTIGNKFIDALNGKTRLWSCVEVVSDEGSACEEYLPRARMVLTPSFLLESDGHYNPDIEIDGHLVVTVWTESGAASRERTKDFRAEWKYREDAGSFFDLAKDDAALLRQKLDNILELFATAVAQDLFHNPRVQTITEYGSITEEGHFEPNIEPYNMVIPDGEVIRVK